MGLINLGPLKNNIKQDMRTQRNSIRVSHLEKALVKYVFKCDCLLV